VQEQVQGADKILSGQYLLSLPQAFQVVLFGKGGGEGTLLESYGDLFLMIFVLR
jgi:hypothetical protein